MQYDKNNAIDNRLFYSDCVIDLGPSNWNNTSDQFTHYLGFDRSADALVNPNTSNGVFSTTIGSERIELKSTMRFIPENYDNTKESEWDDVELEKNEVLIECHE